MINIMTAIILSISHNFFSFFDTIFLRFKILFVLRALIAKSSK